MELSPDVISLGTAASASLTKFFLKSITFALLALTTEAFNSLRFPIRLNFCDSQLDLIVPRWNVASFAPERRIFWMADYSHILCRAIEDVSRLTSKMISQTAAGFHR